MARKFDLISELYERTCFAVTDNPVNWQSFLKTAGRNFRLRFDEQLLIYAQRPDATAVLEIERWNGTFGRWVNRGAKGIAVFEDADRSRQRLIHYFDISDTHESRYSRPVPIWEMRPEYEAEVIETLENTFGAVNDTTSIENVVKESIANAVVDNIADYISDFMSLSAGSDIEYLSADEANALYLELVKTACHIWLWHDWGWTQTRFILPMTLPVFQASIHRKFSMRWVLLQATLQKWRCSLSAEQSVRSARKIA